MEEKTLAENGAIIRLTNGKIQLQVKKILQDFISFSFKENRGRPVDNSDYYKFTAVGENGELWVAEKVLLVKSNLSLSDGCNEHTFDVCSNCIQVNNITEQENNSSSDTASTISLFINEELNLPTPWKRAIKSGSSVTYTFPNRNKISLSTVSSSEGPDNLCIHYCFSTTENSINIANSLCESMGFILAQQVSWFYLERRIGNKTDTWLKPSLRKLSYDRGRAKPPVQLDYVCGDRYQQFFSKSTDKVICSESDLWALYEKYFRFISKDRNESEVHHLSSWMNRLIEINQQSLEAEMLTISVSIESLVTKYSDILYQKVEKSSEEAQKFQYALTALETWIEKHKKSAGEDSFHKRIDGFLSGLKSNGIRAQDILKVLDQKKIVDKSLVDSWGKVRNKAAHGGIINSEKVARYMKHTNKVNLLFFHLVFLIIKYEGPFSDYSQDGWPTEIFQKRITR